MKMKIEELKKEVERLVSQAVEAQREGKPGRGLRLLREAEDKLDSQAKSKTSSLLGLIRHYQGRIYQSMGDYPSAIIPLRTAVALRKGNPVDYAYSKFQFFICKDYGGFMITPREVIETKAALWGLIDASKNPRELGDAFQNLAYIESRKGDIRKAVWLYQAAEIFRGIARDERGFALTWARLGECYLKIGEQEKAEEYGRKALEYFKKSGDIERIKQVREKVFLNKI